MPPVREWRLHIGAHKTATTHLQDSLAGNRDWLLEQGVDFLPMMKVRALRLPPSPGRYDWRLRLRRPMRRKIEDLIGQIRSGPSRIAFSEENILGVPNDLLSSTFYPDAVRRLRAFDTLSPSAEVRIFISVRRFDQVMASAYVQELRIRPMPGGFEPIRAAAVRRPPRWSELIERVRKAVPKARLSVWTFEDYIKSEHDIFSHFCGVQVPLGHSVPVPTTTKSPSAEAVALMEKVDSSLSRTARLKVTGDITAADKGEEPFRPFGEREQALLREAYEEDLARMSRAFPGLIFKV